MSLSTLTLCTFIISLALLGGALHYARQRWGTLAALWLGVFGVGLSGGTAVLMPYSPPGSKDARTVRYAYVGISSEAVFRDTYHKLLSLDALDKPRTIVFFVRPEAEHIYSSLQSRGDLQGSKCQTVTSRSLLGETEGLILEDMISHLTEQLHSGKMAPDADVYFAYPRVMSLSHSDSWAALAALRSGYEKCTFTSLRQPADFALPSRRASYEPPAFAFVNPATDVPAAETEIILMGTQRAGSPGHRITAQTYETKGNVPVSPFRVVQRTFSRHDSSEVREEPAENTPLWNEANVTREMRFLMAAPKLIGDVTNPAKTLQVRLSHQFVDRAGRKHTETVVAATHCVKLRATPAAFLGSKNQASLLFRALSPHHVAYPLDLGLTESSRQADLQKMELNSPSFVAIDGANGFTMEQVQQFLKLCADPSITAPSLLLVDPRAEWGQLWPDNPATLLQRSPTSPRLVVVRLDQSFSLADTAKSMRPLAQQLALLLRTRAFDADIPAGYWELDESVHRYLTGGADFKGQISDYVVLYDPNDPRNTGDDPTPYVRQFLDANPPSRLVMAAGNHSHPATIIGMESANRLKLYRPIITDNSVTHAQFRDWISSEIMPRLSITADADGVLSLPSSGRQRKAFTEYVRERTARALLNGYCAYRKRSDWRSELTGKGMVPILWTEHWNVNRTEDGLASPFLVRLPSVRANQLEFPVYQLCAELQSNITAAGSDEQRQKLVDVMMRLFELSSSFAAQHPLQASAGPNEVSFWRGDAMPLSIKLQGAPAVGETARVPVGTPIIGGTEISGDTLLPVVPDLNQMARPRVLFSNRDLQPKVLRAFIETGDEATGRLDMLLALPGATANILATPIPEAMAQDKLETNSPAASHGFELPGRLLPWVSLFLATVLLIWTIKF